MAENTNIEWATHTFNPWLGCTKIKSGDAPSACDFCYAEAWAKRYGMVEWGNHPRKLTSDANWKKPLAWARVARDRRQMWQRNTVKYREPERPRVFCASLADVFDNQAPQEWRERLWHLISCTPELDWMLLTKRPQNILKMTPEAWRSGLPANIWCGVTAENQTEYDRRMGFLQHVPATVHFVSYEPALGPLKMTGHGLYPTMIICGGEDFVRPGREMDLQWARDLRDECAIVGTKFFFKQINGKGPIPEDLRIREMPV